MGTHVGTHLDAPNHFSKIGWSVEQIPFERLFGVDLVVVDLSLKVKANRSYCFTKNDFENHAKEHSVVLVYTGMSELVEWREAYFGTSSNKLNEMKIPGFTKEAADFLVQRKVYGVGLDSPSADCSERHDGENTLNPVAHEAFNSNNLYIIENLSNKLQGVLELKNSYLKLHVLPLAMTNFSGSPVRPLVTSRCRNVRNGATSRLETNYHTLLIILLTSIFFYNNRNM